MKFKPIDACLSSVAIPHYGISSIGYTAELFARRKEKAEDAKNKARP